MSKYIIYWILTMIIENKLYCLNYIFCKKDFTAGHMFMIS